MDLLTLQKFQRLVQHQAEGSLSLYMPAIKAGQEIQQNPIRLKNLVTEAASHMEERGIGRSDRDAFLAPIKELLSDREFWQNQEKGLALFVAIDYFKTFRLPPDFEERVVLDRRFHIKPLLPLFLKNERFYLLFLSRKDLRLFVGTRYDLAEKELPETPTSLEEALKIDDPERELQYHAIAAGKTGDGAIFHGHHPETDQEANLKRYFHLVFAGLMRAIGERSEPLILAGLDYLHPIYHQANSYRNLLEEGISGNPDQSDLEELHQRAWNVIKERIANNRAQVLDHYHSPASDQTSEKLEEIIPVAYHARVDTLLIDLDHVVWGSYDLNSDSLHLAEENDPGSRDLIDLAVIHTLLNGGSVQMLSKGDLKEQANAGAAAILRY